MARRILFVHGRSWKPSRPALASLWERAVRHGIARSHPEKLAAFDATRKELAYYGDLSNAFLRDRGGTYSESEDVADRESALAALQEVGAHQFTRRRYRRLPGRTSLKEFFADAGSGPLRWLQLSEPAISHLAPDMCEYWNPDSEFGGRVRWAFTERLRDAMDSGDEILVVAHSLGTLIAWDTFWKFSYYQEYRDYRSCRVSLWITLGSPLGDVTVQDHLKGARASGPRRFPANVVRWENLAAEDDYISHDQRVADDFRNMHGPELATERIRDYRIYNLAVRHGRSNPHSSVGYLIHPKTARLIAEWL
ncbi:MAG: hypothetical protein ACE5HQ_10610 [Gemmatimonadota bacterium]